MTQCYECHDCHFKVLSLLDYGRGLTQSVREHFLGHFIVSINIFKAGMCVCECMCASV